MSILYISEQGASLTRKGNRLRVEKMGRLIHWVHASKVHQVVLLGNVKISPGALSFLLEEGIDTVFMSIHGKYRGRLISCFSKNIELRRAQFSRFEDPEFRLRMARAYIRGKIANCRVLMRRRNQKRRRKKVTDTVHRLRMMARRLDEARELDELMGMEGHAAALYFGAFGELITEEGFSFTGRNRRPPRDPVNVLLSFGYTLLANAIQTQVHVAGLDPYLGCLHGVEYGRPSLVLDLMEEFRPVLVDSLVLHVINKRIVRKEDFYVPEEREPAAFDFAETEPDRSAYPIALAHGGVKKFIARFEEQLNRRILYLPTGRRITYRDVCLEQVRRFARCLQDKEEYEPFVMK